MMKLVTAAIWSNFSAQSAVRKPKSERTREAASTK